MIKVFLGYMWASVQFLILAFGSTLLGEVEKEVLGVITLVLTFGIFWLVGKIKE